jgi:hypothetical protein
MTMSPGTSSRASMTISWPSRRTVTRSGRRERKRAAARSARYSWRKAKIPLRRITATIARASSVIPAMEALAAAIQSRRAKRCVTWASANRHSAGDCGCGSSFSPNRARRAWTSASVSPLLGSVVGIDVEDEASSPPIASTDCTGLRELPRRGSSPGRK